MTRIMKLNDHQTPHPTTTLNTPSQPPSPTHREPRGELIA